MSFKLRASALLFVLMIAGNFYAYAQSVRGKVIYISTSNEVKMKFRSAISNYSFVNKAQAPAFKIKHSGKSLHINNVLENFRPANLVITEGQNTHLFILTYSSGADASTETVYDFSSKEKLQETPKVIVQKSEPVQNVQVKNNTAETNTIVTQAVVKQPAEQTANKTEPPQVAANIPARPDATAAAEPVNNKHITSVATAPAKVNSETAIKPTYSSEIAKATEAYRAKQYASAKAYFLSAQKLNPSAKYPGVRISELNGLIARQRKRH